MIASTTGRGSRRPPWRAAPRVFTDDRALAQLDLRRLGVQDRAVHHPGAWADADVADQRCGRCDERGRVDDRLPAAMTQQH